MIHFRESTISRPAVKKARTTRRRRPAEVRRLLLEAAGRVFRKKGYGETTVEEIFTEAGVARSATYRHFSSKSDLFRHAILQPFVEILQEYSATWGDLDDVVWSEETLAETLVGLTYDSFDHHRDTFLAIVGALGSMDDDINALVQTELQRFFDAVMVYCYAQARRSGWIPLEGLEMTVRLTMGSVAAAVLMADLFLPTGPNRPTRDQIVKHISALALYGNRLTKNA
ncbi:MAG: helix-turn-helix domain-containing protein [Porticoccaceae bacterium]